MVIWTESEKLQMNRALTLWRWPVCGVVAAFGPSDARSDSSVASTMKPNMKAAIATVSAHGVSSSFYVNHSALEAFAGKTLAPAETIPHDESFTFVVVGDGVCGRAAVDVIRAAGLSERLLVLGRNRPAAVVDATSSTVTCVDGRVIRYERCLIAAGAKPGSVPNSDDFVGPDCHPLLKPLHDATDRAELLNAARAGR